MLLEAEHRLQPVALDRVLGEGGLLQAHGGDLLLQFRILLPGVAQVDVVVPDAEDQTVGARPNVMASSTAIRTRAFLKRTKKDSMGS